MTVSTYTQPDFTTQSAAAYKTNIDAATAVLATVGQDFAPHEAGTPDMTVLVDAGKLFKPDGTLVSKAQQTTATFTAPAGNPRTDRVVVDVSTGDVSVVAGTEAASPVAPAIPAGKIPICQVALLTSTTSIANSIITDERVYILRTPLMVPPQEVSATGGDHVVDVADGGGLLLVDATLAEQTVWLPDAAAAGKGWTICVKKTDSGSNKVVIQVSATGQTVDGAASIELLLQDDSAVITCDGATFHRFAAVNKAPIFTKSYDSGEQTITSAGPLTLAHGLSATPRLIMLYLKCTTAEFNYSVDDEVVLNPAQDSQTSRGISTVPDGTNVNIRYGSAANALSVVDKTTGATQAITNSSWRLIVRAWA